jgi:hypothetical protein
MLGAAGCHIQDAQAYDAAHSSGKERGSEVAAGSGRRRIRLCLDERAVRVQIKEISIQIQ